MHTGKYVNPQSDEAGKICREFILKQKDREIRTLRAQKTHYQERALGLL